VGGERRGVVGRSVSVTVVAGANSLRPLPEFTTMDGFSASSGFSNLRAAKLSVLAAEGLTGSTSVGKVSSSFLGGGGGVAERSTAVTVLPTWKTSGVFLAAPLTSFHPSVSASVAGFLACVAYFLPVSSQ